jgi:hypothetical protein
MAAARIPKLNEDWNGSAFDHPVEIYIRHRLEA